MHNVSFALEILQTGAPVPVGWNNSSGHFIWYVKMYFTRKDRWVKDGNRTPDTKESIYVRVVSRDSVRIDLTYAALKDVDVTASNIQNVYLQATYSKKHYVIFGKEFGL